MIVRSLEVMGEAAKRLPDEFRQRHPRVPWRQMTRLRDVLAHEYDRLDTGEIWKVATEDVPMLIPVLRQLLDELDLRR